MTVVGKEIRLDRIRDRETGNMVIVPMDHGITVGPIRGIVNLSRAVHHVSQGGASAVLMHQGMVSSAYQGVADVGLIIHLSASTSITSDSNHKNLVSSVERAIQLGADAVSVHVNIGHNREAEMLKDFGDVSEKCYCWGMPLIAMVYSRGERIKNEYEVSLVKHAARLACEMGADIVKVSYTGSPSTFQQVVEGTDIPVIIAGGPKMDTDEEILEMARGAMEAGGAGLSIGRNVFQHHDPRGMTEALSTIVKGASVEEAEKILKGKKEVVAA